MFSKLFELTGTGLIAWGVSLLLGAPAGIIIAGLAILLVGGVTDDAAVGVAFKRGWYWTRYAWYRQVARENGVSVPNLRASRAPNGLVLCDCGGQDDCPLCFGSGYAPDPNLQTNGRSPHPALRVDPETTARAQRQARARAERSRLYDRTPALSRFESDEDV